MPTSAFTQQNVKTRLMPVYPDPEPVRQHVNLKPASSGQTYTLTHGQVLGEVVGVDEIQTITISATGGTFKVTFGAQQSAAIAYNASAAAVEDALEALSTILEGNVAVSLANSVYTVHFQGALGRQNVAAMTTDATSLTGGGSTATVATLTGGAAGTAGQFAAYNEDATDGTQVAKMLLEDDVTVDDAGNLSYGTLLPYTVLSTPAFLKGTFRTGDCVGLTLQAIADMGGALVSGSIFAGGIFKI